MKTRKIILATAASLMLLPMSVMATEKGAGCGIGKEIMKGKTGTGAHVVAAILNAVIIPNTFFMTTGILGCDVSQQVQNEQNREVFVASNMDNITRDVAQGQGEYLASLANIMGIQEEDKQDFFSITQKNSEKLLSAKDANELLAYLDNSIQGSKLAKYSK